MSLFVRYQPIALGGGGGGGGGGSGSANGNGTIATADLYDPVTTSVTSGPAISSPFIVDGVTVTNNMLVLFSNLGSDNNQIYKASVVGPNITWTAQSVFAGNTSPIPPAGALIVITEGDSFANQVGEFDGSTWLFNYTVRYFNGVDYFEQSSINTSELVDNTADGTVFSVGYSGSENIIVDYSIIRDGVKEAGTIYLTTDTSTVGIAVEGSSTGATGVSFSSVISGSDIVLQYTTSNTGDDAIMKYAIRRWSDAAGGPGGPPSYSGGSSIVPAAGANGNIQFNGGGSLDADPDFSYDSTDDLLLLGDKQVSILNNAVILDNQASPVDLFTIPDSYTAVFVEYSIQRDGFSRVGMLKIANDGTLIGNSDDFASSGDVGVSLVVSLGGGNIKISYTSSSLGSGGTFRYSYTRW